MTPIVSSDLSIQPQKNNACCSDPIDCKYGEIAHHNFIEQDIGRNAGANVGS